MIRGTCALCKEKRNLVKSHILPRSILRLLSLDLEKYDGQIIAIHSEDPSKPIHRPGGSYSYLFCEKCDNKIGDYDDYAKQFTSSTKLEHDNSGLGWIAKNVDQKKLKLFFLSYLWRASLSPLSEFEEVSLGDRHEERLRKMILSDDAGGLNDYTTLVTRYRSQINYDIFSKIVMIPASIRLRNVRFYEIYMPNLYKFYTKVDQQSLDKEILTHSLGARSFLPIYDGGDYENTREYKILFKARKQATIDDSPM